MKNEGMRFRVTFHNADGTVDTVSVWAPSAEEAIDTGRARLEEYQGPTLEEGTPTVKHIGASPEPSDLGVATSGQAVAHERASSGGEPLSTPFRPNREHILRLTDQMRSRSGPTWVLLRRLLAERGLEPRRAVVVGLQPPEVEPTHGLNLVYEDHRVFSFFPSDHPVMEQGLPVITDDGSFEMASGPALIELPSLDSWSSLVRAALEIIDQDPSMS